MRFTVVAAVFAVMASAVKVNPNDIPQCIRDCSIPAAAAVGCRSPLDLKCVCNNGAYTSNAATCIQSKCGIQLLIQASTISTNLCDATNGGVDCVGPNFAQCGDLCIDITVQHCISGVPSTRRSLNLCPEGQSACKVTGVFGIQGLAGNGYDCVDIQTNLESCGGCIGEGGMDCTGIYGAADVECHKGKCIVSECEEGLSLINGRCK